MITTYFLGAFTGMIPATSDNVPLGLLTGVLVGALVVFVALSLYKAFFAAKPTMPAKPEHTQRSQQGDSHEG